MSKIFNPYRVLGLCASEVPFVVKFLPHSNAYHALVPIGENFNVYKLPRLTLVGISDSLPCRITAFTSNRNFVFAAAGRVIYFFRNSRYIAHELHGHEHKITKLLAFSGSLLASLDEACVLKIWDLQSLDIVFSEEFPSNSFKITEIACPLGYKNKLFLGSFQGPLQLWNVKSAKQLYWFKGFRAAVTCISQAPALDVCAIGLGDGRIVLHNLKYDVSLLNFAQDGGAVTVINFRNGCRGLINPSNIEAENELTVLSAGDEDLFMVTGSFSGQVNCWQLKENGESRPVGGTQTLHWDRIISMFCIPGGDAAGAMVTSGADNCIRVSYFDRPDGGPRTVYKRSGHFRPPNRVAFWSGGSAGGSLLLSAGQDSMLRIFSTFNENLDKSFGRAYAPGVPDRRKTKAEERLSWLLPAISQISLCATRAEDWDSVVAIHSGRRQATTWNFVNSTRGKHWLDPAKFSGKGGAAVRLYKHTVATAVFITNCGNYVLIGYSSGDVVKFNLQSGLERGCYGEPSAHSSPVVGISVNNVNRQAVTVGGSEVNFWSFHKHELLATIGLPSPALFSRFNGDTDTLAVPLNTGPIVLMDATRRQVIRRFFNSELQTCADLTISSDGRWLISAHHGDPLIKTWDIVHGRLIDCFRVSTPITSVALSPASDFLATTHANSLGIHLWDNRGLYQRLHLHPLAEDYVPPANQKPVNVPSRSLVAQFKEDSEHGWKSLEVGLRSDGEFTRVGALSSEESSESDERDEDVDKKPTASTAVWKDYVSPEQLPDHLATLSGLSSTYLSNFLQLDLIRERNREATAPASTDQNAGVNLPFFLPVMETSKGLAWVDEATSQDDPMTGGDHNQRKQSLKRHAGFSDENLIGLEPIPGLTSRMTNAKGDNEFDEIMKVLKSLGPSALDLEIRLLAPSVEEEDAVGAFLNDNLTPTFYLTTLARLHGFLHLLINRFERNLDVDLACVCLENFLHRHGDFILNSVAKTHSQLSTGTGEIECKIDALLSTEGQFPYDDRASSHPTFQLIARAVEAKEKAARLLTRRLTRSICLVDFIRNPTTTLQL